MIQSADVCKIHPPDYDPSLQYELCAASVLRVGCEHLQDRSLAGSLYHNRMRPAMNRTANLIVQLCKPHGTLSSVAVHSLA